MPADMPKEFRVKPQLIIFDNDGVLIDSDIAWHTINVREMTRLGFSITLEKSISLLTRSIREEFDNVMLQEYGKTISDIDKRAINQKTEDAYPTYLKPIKDIEKVLDYLEKRNVKKCIASNADNEYVISTLTIPNLLQYFKPDQIFSSPMVNNKRKPEPDVFLHAADNLKIAPKDCLVIEDHPLGIKAAKAANMPVVGFYWFLFSEIYL